MHACMWYMSGKKMARRSHTDNRICFEFCSEYQVHAKALTKTEKNLQEC